MYDDATKPIHKSFDRAPMEELIDVDDVYENFFSGITAVLLTKT